MSTLNAPPPPLPDQNASTVTTTSDAPRGDQKMQDVQAVVRDTANDLAMRLIDERNRLARDQLELLAAADVAKKAEEARREEQRRADEARLEEERLLITRLTVDTNATNLSAGTTFAKVAVTVAGVGGLLAYWATSGSNSSKKRKRNKK